MPCEFALQTYLVPAQKWRTRADLVAVLKDGLIHLTSAPLGEADLLSASKAAGLSPFHFQRLFRSVYGVTPHQVLARRRLDVAVFLLSNTRLPLWRIAREVGLAGAPALCRFVRANSGLSPRSLR